MGNDVVSTMLAPVVLAGGAALALGVLVLALLAVLLMVLIRLRWYQGTYARLALDAAEDERLGCEHTHDPEHGVQDARSDGVRPSDRPASAPRAARVGAGGQG